MGKRHFECQRYDDHLLCSFYLWDKFVQKKVQKKFINSIKKNWKKNLAAIVF